MNNLGCTTDTPFVRKHEEHTGDASMIYLDLEQTQHADERHRMTIESLGATLLTKSNTAAILAKTVALSIGHLQGAKWVKLRPKKLHQTCTKLS